MNVDVSFERRSLDFTSGANVSGLQRPDRAHDLSALCGYLGDSDADGCQRLFTDPTLKSWIDIAEEAIRYRCRIPGEQGAYGGRSVVWVANDALLVTGEVATTAAEADFLSGPLSREALGQLGDEGIAYAAQGPKFFPTFGASPYLTPPGYGCCR